MKASSGGAIRRILSPDEHFTGMTALVVDDSHPARNIIVENISREGLSTIEELNTAERERTKKPKLQGVVEMAGTVCHELNQPIQTISGLAELTMMKADEKNPLINYIKKIKHQVDRMGKITGQLMNVTAYRTKPHDTLTHIIDIDNAAGNQT